MSRSFFLYTNASSNPLYFHYNQAKKPQISNNLSALAITILIYKILFRSAPFLPSRWCPCPITAVPATFGTRPQRSTPLSSRATRSRWSTPSPGWEDNVWRQIWKSDCNTQSFYAENIHLICKGGGSLHSWSPVWPDFILCFSLYVCCIPAKSEQV